MNIPKEVKQLPWPDYFDGNPQQHCRINVRYFNANHERLLLVTFSRNRKSDKTLVAPDFQYVLSKKHQGVAVHFRVTLRRCRKNLREMLDSWGVYIGRLYPEISEADEKKLSAWLGKPMAETRNHMIPELEEWIIEAIKAEQMKEGIAKGRIMDSEYALCPEELPEGIERFIRREVIPNDNVLLYKKGNVRGRCFCCGEKVKAFRERFTQNSIVRCPNCGKMVYTYLETSDYFKVNYVQNIASIQKGTDGETVFVRLWHLCRDSEAKWDFIENQLQEICRWAIRGNKVDKWQKEAKTNWYMNSYRYDLSKWTRVDKPSVIYDGSYIFYLPPNQEEIFEGTSLRYCDLQDYLNRVPKRNKNPIRFLMDWPRYSMMEKLWKAGYSELVYQKNMGIEKKYITDIKWTAPSIGQSVAFPKRMLKLMKPEEWDMDYVHRAIEGWKMVESGKLRENEMLMFIRSKVETEDIHDALGFASFHRIMKYLDGLQKKALDEYNRNKREKERLGESYHGPYPRQNYSATFRDYLSDCKQLKLDLRDRDILFPKDLDAAHARTTSQIQYKANQEREASFQKICTKNRWMEWEHGDYFIRLPVDGQEVIYEGQYLHHCVGGYVDRMANGKTLILFIREKTAPEKPFYTLEWLNGKVQQCHTTRNKTGPCEKEVQMFVREWEEALPKLKKKDVRLKIGA